MKLTRRQAIGALGGGVLAGLALEWRLPGAWGQAAAGGGPFQPTWASLENNYKLPDWYRDAKFGIWAHWGPQCQPADGDWYAQRMYMQGQAQYAYHVQHYGHPSKFGFKDVINAWKAEKWDPAAQIKRFQAAGARFFVSMANHHDNFDNFDSKFQPWNSVNMGPKKDVVGTWSKVAREAGLRVGISVHAARAWNWYEAAQGADATGPLAGVPYDGKLTKADGKGLWWEGYDPQDLYAQNHAVGAQPDAAYIAKFVNRMKDLMDKYHPDLLFFDDTKLPLGNAGLDIAAHFYNTNPQWNAGKLSSVIICNGLTVQEQSGVVNHLERNYSTDMLRIPWSKGNVIGPWHYALADYNRGYLKPAAVINHLVDVVSKNGTLLLAIPQPGDGSLDDKATAFLDEMAKWMAVNSECIYDTRPWGIYGEGPAVKNDATAKESAVNPPRGLPAYTAAEVRFTTKGNVLYAIGLGTPPGGKITIKALAANAPLYQGEIGNISLLGGPDKLEFTRDNNGLVVTVPVKAGDLYAVALKISPKV